MRKKAETPIVKIKPPNMQSGVFVIQGTAPLVINAFSRKARDELRAKHAAGGAAKKSPRTPKDFVALYEGAKHKSREGWDGISAPAFRNGMISACRLLNYPMTRAKLSLFIKADGFDAIDGTPLVRIMKGKPRPVEHVVRNETGVVDIRSRPMWDEWEAAVRLEWDGDQFTREDVANLMLRVGLQVGIGEGRPDSKNSGGMGWGTFTLKGLKPTKETK